MRSLLTTALVLALLPRSASAGEPQRFTASVVSSSSDGLVLEFVVPPPTLKRVIYEGTAYTRVTLPGFGSTSQPGRPALPIRGVLVGIPTDGSAKIDAVEVVTVQTRRVKVLPLPRTVFEPAARPRRELVVDRAFYRTRGVFPARAARLGFEGVIRGQKVAQLLLHPFRVKPRAGLLLYYPRIRVKLSISGQSAPVRQQADAFERIKRALIVNHPGGR